MLYKKICCIILAIILCLSFSACGRNETGGGGTTSDGGTSAGSGEADISDGEISEIEADEAAHNFVLSSGEDGHYEYVCSDCDKTAAFTVAFASGSENAYSVDGNTLTFSGLAENSVYSLSGEFYGNIVINAGDDYKLELELNGFSVTAYNDCPIYAESGDKITLVAKKDTENYVFDMRSAAGEDEISASVYSACDLAVQGKGALYVKSLNNNGIHSKDELKLKNLTLQVECEDNALKGNDGVSVESGTITLAAKSGDGIKTTNSGVTSKGKQKGSVLLYGGEITVCALSDGIDSAYNAEISVADEEVGLVLKIYTGKYSGYSDETSVSAQSGESDVSVYAFNPNGNHGGQGGFPGGQGGGQGGQSDGNRNKSEESAKGIKAANEILISGGSITIKSYDDSLHANGGDALENGDTATGNVTVSGGSLVLYSDDDALHADGKASVCGGSINVLHSYEGIEGDFVEISGGTVSVVSEDDGLNGTGTSGASITISGGTLYVFAGGDGLDSNSTDRYGGISFEVGKSVIISTGNADSAIDTENGYKYSGGAVLAIGNRGGMNSEESVKVGNFSSIGKSASFSVSAGGYVIVKGLVSVKMPVAINAFAVYLGDASASVSVASSCGSEFDSDGVCWEI